MLEKSRPPIYYIPYQDVMASALRPNSYRSLCKWKGQASYFDLELGDVYSELACWRYGAQRSHLEPSKSLSHSTLAEWVHASSMANSYRRSPLIFTAGGSPAILLVHSRESPVHCTGDG
ncbi:MAG: DUF427 domain-containing protein [Pseudomonadota bacterium]